MTNDRLFNSLQALQTAFTPHQPISVPEFLAGRVEILRRATEAVTTPGLHVLLYGERGTGKTSLARVLAFLLQEVDKEDGRRSIIVSCNSLDSYSSIWEKVFREIFIAERQLGFTQHAASIITGRLSVTDSLNDPNDVRIQFLSLPNPVIVIIDEFDRTPNDNATRRLMADTIKLFSDSMLPVKIMLVGVAESISELIHEHESISRNIAQIQVPPMDGTELAEIIYKGFKQVRLKCDKDVANKIAELSQGYPHFTHLIGYWAALRVIENGEESVTLDDVERAIPEAIVNVSGGIRHEYEVAVTSSQKSALYRDVLLACALAQKDTLGRFAMIDVKEPLRKLTGTSYEPSAYQSHLAKFCDPSRGPVLKRTGKPRNFRWQFINPQLMTYVRLLGSQQPRILF